MSSPDREHVQLMGAAAEKESGQLHRKSQVLHVASTAALPRHRVTGQCAPAELGHSEALVRCKAEGHSLLRQRRNSSTPRLVTHRKIKAQTMLHVNYDVTYLDENRVYYRNNYI